MVGMKRFKTAAEKERVPIDERSIDLTFGQSTPLLLRLVQSRGFSTVVALLIVISSVQVGIETQILSSMVYQQQSGTQVEAVGSLPASSVANYFLTFFFLVEIALRMCAHRMDFFTTDLFWNYFDLCILILSLIEVGVELAVHSFSGHGGNFLDNGGSIRVLRLLRLTRLLRLLRTFRHLKPLRLLVGSIASAGRSVFWALLLLLMIIYAFAVILTQAVTEQTQSGVIVTDALLKYYGTLPRSMASLWWAVSNGISWHELTDPLADIGGGVYVGVFIGYIGFVYFAVLNVVTGVFCQNAMESAQRDLDMTIELQLKEKETYVQSLTMLFDEMRMDMTDGLTPGLFQFHLERPTVQSWFKALDVDTSQVWRLFALLDADDSGRVSITDFVEGCLRLRGGATRIDMESLKWEIRDASRRASKLSARVDAGFAKLDVLLHETDFV